MRGAQLANSWIIINVGGGPTDDAPNVILEPGQNPDRVSSFQRRPRGGVASSGKPHPTRASGECGSRYIVAAWTITRELAERDRAQPLALEFVEDRSQCSHGLFPRRC